MGGHFLKSLALEEVHMNHLISRDDVSFRHRVESCEFPVAEFSHRAHLRLAYVYLVENDTDPSVELMRDTLHRLLAHNGIEPDAKYHETLTKAWMMAVRHFMQSTDDVSSADDFIKINSQILDSKIMLTHYSAEVLFSDEARQTFVQPDLEPIPRYKNQFARPEPGGDVAR